MNIGRRAFIAFVGSAAAAEALSPRARAEALEHFMMQQLASGPSTGGEDQTRAHLEFYDPERKVARGTGWLFSENLDLEPVPGKFTLVDFFQKRLAATNDASIVYRHVLQSAHRAIQTGQPERTVFACLLHDAVHALAKSDHGYWGAQLFGPYVDERVSWGIRYHQALRFFPDPAVGYEYPEFYNRIFGKDYEPDEFTKAEHDYAKKHKWYMEARLITMNDEYAFDRDLEVSLDPFVDIIGRNFKQPKEGLGYDNSPVAHMWRTIENPNRPL
jgi:hypothetical protein